MNERQSRYAANRERERSQQKVYREENRQVILAAKKARREEEPERVKEERDRSYWSDPEKVRERNAQRRRTPSGKYSSLLAGAKRRGIEVTLTFDEYVALTKDASCHYHSGPLPSAGYGLDRKDSKLGYSLSNCVPCCSICNDLKGDALSYEQAKAAIAAALAVSPEKWQLPPDEVPSPQRPQQEPVEPHVLDLLVGDLQDHIQKVDPEVGQAVFVNGERQVTVHIQPLWNPNFRPRKIIEENPDSLVFRSSEVVEKPLVVNSLLKHYLGLSRTIGARECQLVAVTPYDSKEFFDLNHLKGNSYAPTIGLEFQGKLVATMSYKLSKRVLDIHRFATASGVSVAGGFGKLLNQAILLERPIAVTSFVDLRYHRGSGYDKSGFARMGVSEGWSWTDGEAVYHRLKCRANMDHRGLTEAQHAAELGWWKIKDAGQAKYLKTIVASELPQGKPEVKPETAGRKLDLYYERERRKSYSKIETITRENQLQLVTSFEEYSAQVNQHRVVHLVCAKGHRFNRLAERVHHVRDCPECKGLSNDGGAFKTKLANRGWSHLSGEYTNKNSQLECECSSGHRFVRQYRWFRDKICPTCNPIEV